MKKVIISLALVPLFLAGCSTTNEVSSVSGVRDKLADTNWACDGWEEYEPGIAATCGLPYGQGTAWVRVTDNPEMFSAVSFDEHLDMEATVIGDNWVYQCRAPLGASDCEYLAGLLDGELIKRGHWSN